MKKEKNKKRRDKEEKGEENDLRGEKETGVRNKRRSSEEDKEKEVKK